MAVNSASDRVSIGQAKVVWLTQSMGYDNDLLYFAPIIRALHATVPNLKVTVPQDFPTHRYRDLPLLPILTRPHRTSPGQSYRRTRRTTPSISSMTRLFQEHPRVLIVVEFTPLAVAGLLLGKLLGSRCLLLIENDPAFRGSPGGTLKLFVKSKLASLADLILTNNQHGHAFITQRLRFDPSRVRVAPYLTSCPEAVGCQESPSPPLLKRNEHRVNILYLNSITERKGLHILIHAVEHLSPTDRAQLLFHIVGGGERLNELRDLVRSTGLSSEFIFYGPVEYRKIGDFYSNADLYISPTLQDYRSLGGFEALSYGLPLLISQRDGACDEIVTEGSNGWTFDPLNQGQLCYLLEKIARNPCMLTNFRLESLQMRNAFSVLSASSNLAAAISELLAHQIID